MKPWSKRLSLGFLGLCIFGVLVHIVEDWRGRRAWEDWRRSQEAQGARYDPASLQPAPLADADNFAKAPCVQPVFTKGGKLLGDFTLMAPKDAKPGWSLGHLMDLQAWKDANKGEDLEQLLASAAPALAQLSEAARRPGCRFDFATDAYGGREDLGILGFRSVGRALNLRCVLRLRAGQADLALEDALTELRIARHLANSPSILIEFQQEFMAGTAMQGIWEGLSSHAWNGPQLAALQEELSRVDLIDSLLHWAWSERARLDRTYEGMLGQSWWPRDASLSGKFGSLAGHLLLPQGWIYQNRLRSDLYFEETWGTALDPRGHQVHPIGAQAIGSWWEHRRTTPYTFLAKEFALAGPAIATQVRRVAERQVALDEASTVCALERHRLDRKAYPESLHALFPAYTAGPSFDAFGGGALRYRREGDRFQLYSVGWNGIDEGGVMAMAEGHRDASKGDWPWPQPAR